MTREQALALAETKFWENMNDRDIAFFQFYEERLCMPFRVFSRAMQETLGRPVFTHEFADKDRLERELLGDADPPTMKEIINLLPEDKRLIICHP